MKRSSFSKEQIIEILKEQEAGMATADMCRRHGISPATSDKRKSKFGGLEVSEAKRLWSMADENAKLKKLLANTMLDIAWTCKGFVTVIYLIMTHCQATRQSALETGWAHPPERLQDSSTVACPGTACYPFNYQPNNGMTLPLSGNNQGSASRSKSDAFRGAVCSTPAMIALRHQIIAQ